MKVTADLKNVSEPYRMPNWPDGVFVYWGNVFNDTKQRFIDGARIHTSEVIREEGDLIITRNSVYRRIS